MTKVLEARQAFDGARTEARVLVARRRAAFGRSMIEARRDDPKVSQESIARELGVATNQVRRYEQAYRDWLRDHDGQEPD